MLILLLLRCMKGSVCQKKSFQNNIANQSRSQDKKQVCFLTPWRVWNLGKFPADSICYFYGQMSPYCPPCGQTEHVWYLFLICFMHFFYICSPVIHYLLSLFCDTLSVYLIFRSVLCFLGYVYVFVLSLGLILFCFTDFLERWFPAMDRENSGKSGSDGFQDVPSLAAYHSQPSVVLWLKIMHNPGVLERTIPI